MIDYIKQIKEAVNDLQITETERRRRIVAILAEIRKARSTQFPTDQ